MYDLQATKRNQSLTLIPVFFHMHCAYFLYDCALLSEPALRIGVQIFAYSI